jgi:TonB family protein
MTNWLLKFFILSGSQSTWAGKWLGFLWSYTTRCTVILLVAFVLSLVWARSSAAARHLIWVCVFSSLLVLPALSLVVPAWRMSSSVISQAGAQEIMGASKTTAVGRDVRAHHATLPPPNNQETKSGMSLFDRYEFALSVWVLGFGVVLGRLFLGAAHVGQMAKRAKLLASADWTGLLRGVAGEFQLNRVVALVQCDGATMPMAWGFLQPVILLPRNAGQWSMERRRIVISHEIAHVRRQDCFTQFMAQTACAVYWFNPLVWLAARKLRQESERACDDCVLNLGTKPSDYAEHLLDLARSLKTPQPSWALAMANPSQLEGRMVAMLDPRRNRDAVTRSRALLTSLLFAALVLPLAALRGVAGAETPKLAGRVYDPSGRVVPGTVITAINLDTHTKQTIISGSAGEYEFPAIPAGKYVVEVSKPGFRFEPLRLVVGSGKRGEIDLKLTPGSVVESVDVVARARRKNPAGPAAAKPKRILLGDAVEAAKLLTRVMPVYPQSAIDQGLEGTVLIKAVISVEGNILSADVINGPDPALGEAALEAVKQWHYRPTLLNGEPIEVVTTITARFRLEE